MGQPPLRQRRRAQRGTAAYWFVAPHLVLFAALVAYPIAYGLWISLHAWNLFGVDSPWVGLGNYTDLFKSSGLYSGLFWRTFRNSALFVLISTPTIVVLAMALAALIDGMPRFSKLFRGIFLFPWTLSVSVSSILWWNLLNSSSGFVPSTMQKLGLGSPDWLSSQPWAWISILIATTWSTVGFSMILFLAGMQAVRQDLLEAATLDGANTWQRYRHVTLPTLRPIILLAAVLQIISSFNLIAQPQLMTGGGPPPNTTTPVLLFVYETGFKDQFNLGPAAAMAVLLAVVMGGLSYLNFRFLRTERS